MTLVIPVHPPRLNSTLPAAIASVWEQTALPDSLVVAVDTGHEGAAATRNRGLRQVDTEFTAFLDSDDLLRPFHLEALAAHLRETGADLVFPHFDVVGGADPFARWEHTPFDPAELDTFNRIPVTVLARTGLLRAAGGFQPLGPPENPCDDHGCWRALVRAGGRIEHLDRRTWLWRHHPGNSSGRGDTW